MTPQNQFRYGFHSKQPIPKSSLVWAKEGRLKKMRIRTFAADSLFPEKNFLDVIDIELSKGSYDTLVIGGGTVDITNIDTVNEPFENIAALREMATDSAQKLFSIAEASLHHHPSLKKVVLLKRPPRYDPNEFRIRN